MYYEKTKAIEDYIIAKRRHYHENPELSSQEFETLKDIKNELDEMGIYHIEVPNGGILGFIYGQKEGPDRKVLLRADMDALPVDEQEENLAGPRVALSKNPGIMHACGHDGHTAMLLGAAKVLMEERDNFPGQVILCFERGEEGTQNYREIHAYMEKFDIVPDTCWAIHLQAEIESGKLGIRDDSMMAGAIFFDVDIEGQGGHGSRPDLSVNPISAFNAIYNYLQAYRLERRDPFETMTYSIGAVNAGHVPNVIPQKLNFKGNVRFMDRHSMGMHFYEDFKDNVEKIAEVYGSEANFLLYPKPGFPVKNDEKAAQWARQIMAEEFGQENIIIPEPWMASESFGAFLEQWPGVFAFLGVKNDEKGIGAAHHNEYFDIDEDVLAMGAAGFVKYAIEYLNSDIEFPQKDYKGRFRDYLEDIGTDQEDIDRIYAVEKQD